MRYDETELVLIVDRSGSMGDGRSDTEEGINALLSKYRESGKKVRVTITQFDHAYEHVCISTDIKDVPQFELRPRGVTALLDAVGRTIAEVGDRLAAMDEADRPGLVVVVVVTDGAENASTDVTREALAKTIKEQQEVYKWQFVFLGADFDAFQQAGQLGVSRSNTANYAKSKSAEVYEMTGNKLLRASAMVCSLGPEGPTGPNGPGGPMGELGYTDEERAEIADDAEETTSLNLSGVGK